MSRRNAPRVSRRPRMVEALESRCLMTGALLADVNDYGIYPTNLAAIGGWTYFRTVEPDGGYALERTDGSGSPQVVEEFATRTGYDTPEIPQTPVSFDGSVYYIVGPGASSDSRIDKFDPATGTITTAIPLGPDVPYGTATDHLTVVNNQWMIFTNVDKTTGKVALYGTDGTPGGTVLLASDVTGYLHFERLGSSIVFIQGSSPAQSLWTTDGTVAGTRQLTTADGVAGFAADGDKILFSHLHTTANPTPYVASVDATGATQILANNVIVTRLAGSPDGIGYFATGLLGAPTSLYVTDGTTAGTSLITTIPTSVTPAIDVHVVAGDKGYFTATNSTTGTTALWVSDGTAAGTFAGTPDNASVISGFATTGALTSDDPYPIIVAEGNRVFFAASTPSQGEELWTSDGTIAGTHTVSDLVLGSEGSNPLALTATPDGVVFSGNAADHQTGIYLAAPDGSGTTTLVQFDNGQTDSSLPQSAVTIGDKTLFLTSTILGTSIWVTDGTPAGTFDLSDQVPGLAGQFAAPVGTVNGDVLIKVGSSNFTYWGSDGTAAGTVYFGAFPVGGQLIPGNNSHDPTLTTVIGSQTFSLVTNGDGSKTLQVVDSSTGTTTALRSFPNGPTETFPTDNVTYNGKFYYLISGGPDRGLYVSDGTVAGTVAVAHPTATSLNGLAVVGGQLTFIISRDPSDIDLPPGLIGGDYLLASNGTNQGTYILSRLGSYAVLDSVLDQAVTEFSNGTYLVFADDGLHGTEPMLVTPDTAPPPPPLPPPAADLSAPAISSGILSAPVITAGVSTPATSNMVPYVLAPMSLPTDPAPVTVLSVVPSLGTGTIAIHSSGQLDAVSANSMLSYRVVRLTPARHGTFLRHVVPIRSASYDAASHTVTLTLRRRVASGSFEVSAPGLLDSQMRPVNPSGVMTSFRAGGLPRGVNAKFRVARFAHLV